MLHIFKNITIKDSDRVGCSVHAANLTKKIVNFYLVFRANTIAKSYNAINNKKGKKVGVLGKNLNYKVFIRL